MPFEGLIQVLARMDAWDQALPLASNPETLRRYYRWSGGVSLLFVGLLIIAGIVWSRLNEAVRNVIYSLTETLTISCALMIYMFRMGFEGPWAPISVIMKNPAASPVYGHRLLFVWIAKAIQEIVPNLSDLRSFYLSQLLATLLAVYVLGRWSALHVGKAFSWLGQILGVLMISTCFGYFNFYDIGTVFFTTCALLAIYTRRYWWLVPIVVIGTLNYEGVLLLIPLAAVMAYEKESSKSWVPAIATSLVAYSAVRVVLQAFIPLSRQVNWRIWSNMTKPFVMYHQMSYSVLALAGWYAIGLMSLRYSDPRLRRLSLLFPLIFGVTFLFGQFHEPRQFDAFIPVVVALLLSASKRKLELELALHRC